MCLVRLLLACGPCALLFLVVLQPLELAGQTSRYEGKRVADIVFEPREQPLEDAEIARMLPLKRGEPMHIATVRASIARLFATGRYEDIQVDAEPHEDGVIVTFITRNSWFIGNVSVSGHMFSPPNASQLVNAARLELGQPYTEAKLSQAIAGQKRLLENNGLFEGDTRPKFDYDTLHQQINIRFEIDSGRRAHFGPPVLQGDLKLDPAKITSATKFRRFLIHTWKPMSQIRMHQGLDGVRALYLKEDRLESKVALESVAYDAGTNSAIPSLVIDGGPRIQVNTIGFKISEGRLKRLVPIYEERAVDNDLLAEGARNIRDYLQSQGYFEAEVQFKEQKVRDDRATVDYLINSGRQHRLEAIVIRGNEYFKTEVLRERMYLQTANFLQFPHGRYSENFTRRDVDTISNLYQSNGFREVKVTTRVEDNYRGKTGDIAVFFQVSEGPQYFVGRVQMDGVERLDKAKLLSRLSCAEGQPFSEFNVAADRDTILARYSDNGFPNATFEWSSKPSAERYKIDLTFVIHEGRQEFVRDVLVNGLQTTEPSLVFHALDIKAGDPLSPTAIAATQRRLYGLGVFAKVDAAIQNPDGDTPSKYVLFNMEEAARYSLAVGVGAELTRIGGCDTCLDAPAGTAGFSPRVAVDVTRTNLWGVGHSLVLSTRASTLDQRAILTYTWPQFQQNPSLTLSFSGLYENSKDIRTFNSRREQGSVQLAQRISKATSLLYRFTYRRNAIDEGTLKISPLLIPLLSQPVRVGIISLTWLQDKRDDPVDPHRGMFTTVDLGLADHIFGSQRDFGRILARNASYYALGKRTVLARSTQIGDITAFNYSGDPAAAIPLAERFFGGGASSHRGFAENQAGPRDLVTGFPIGGNFTFFNQTELRFPLIGDNLGAVLFHDCGNTYTSISHFSLRQSQRDVQDFDYMVHAVGLGIRYRTPVGPLRVDFAYSINSPNFIGFKANSTADLINAGVNPCQTYPDKCIFQNAGHLQYFFSIGQTF
ncbi:MAG TPA: outer membrane protein assembly factor BamA [Verrucomicrobiae bacterium]|nr:outer membrane protein assembly factor BamA [Verrucomicrobiae bacterium]